MKDKINILILSKSHKLHDEVKSALEPLRESTQFLLRVVTDDQKGVDAARGLRPDILFFEDREDLKDVLRLADNVRKVSPATCLVAAFDSGPGMSDPPSTRVIEAMRSGVSDFMRRPISSGDIQRLIANVLEGKQFSAAGPGRHGKIITVTSNKGGVGKSTMSANIACALAASEPDEVLLIDASVHLGVLSPMLGLRPATNLLDAVRQQDRLDETLLRRLAAHHECGVDLLASPENPVDAAEITDQAFAFILNTARRAYKYIIIDTFPVIDSLVVTSLDFSDHIFVVLEGVVPTVLGCAELLKVFDDIECPREKQSIILNRFSDFRGNLTPDLIEERLDRAIDYVIPYARQSLVAMNLGSPLVTIHQNVFPLKKWFMKMISSAVRVGVQVPGLLRINSEVQFVYEVERIAKSILEDEVKHTGEITHSSVQSEASATAPDVSPVRSEGKLSGRREVYGR